MNKKQLRSQFSVSIIIGPERRDEFFNCWSSMWDLDPSPEHVYLFFNPFDPPSHDIFFDMADIRTCNIFRFSKFQHIPKCWNWSVIHSPTRYVIISNDDVIFQDENLLEKVYEQHQKGYMLVHTTENYSCFSLDKKLIGEIGWFEENLVHSWEDVDFRFRMMRKDLHWFRFMPHLVRHLRSQKGRQDSYWDESSSYFFAKWGIPLFVSPGNPQIFDDPVNRRQLLYSGLFNDPERPDRGVDPKTFSEVLPTPDFYPTYRKLFKEAYKE